MDVILIKPMEIFQNTDFIWWRWGGEKPVKKQWTNLELLAEVSEAEGKSKYEKPCLIHLCVPHIVGVQ